MCFYHLPPTPVHYLSEIPFGSTNTSITASVCVRVFFLSFFFFVCIMTFITRVYVQRKNFNARKTFWKPPPTARRGSLYCGPHHRLWQRFDQWWRRDGPCEARPVFPLQRGVSRRRRDVSDGIELTFWSRSSRLVCPSANLRTCVNFYRFLLLHTNTIINTDYYNAKLYGTCVQLFY